jgi:DNA-binding protein H-NS
MESVKDLIAQREALEKKIKDAQRNERQAAIAQIRDLMSTYELTLADLTARKTPTASPRSANSMAGRKVAAKYRHPKTGDSWSGRGLQPKWLRAELAAGKKLSDFLI